MNLKQIEESLERVSNSKNKTARKVAETLKKNGPTKESIDAVSGSDWYEFSREAREDLVD